MSALTYFSQIQIRNSQFEIRNYVTCPSFTVPASPHPVLFFSLSPSRHVCFFFFRVPASLRSAYFWLPVTVSVLTVPPLPYSNGQEGIFGQKMAAPAQIPLAFCTYL
jgi:hypothetical protein